MGVQGYERPTKPAASSSSSAPETESAALRGVSNASLRNLHNEPLIMISLAVLMEVFGVQDKELIDELRKRSKEEALFDGA